MYAVEPMAGAALLLETDSRVGAQWLAALEMGTRVQLLAALLTQFNHDLRTPLNTILGWTHLLQKGGLDPLRLKHVADVIGRNSNDQTRLLEEFVDDGRAIAQTLQLQFTDVQMDDAVAQAIERAGSLLTLHGVTLQPDYDAPDALVRGDARILERLSYRLLRVIVRRAREASTIELETDVERQSYILAITGTTYEPDWPDAALLDLRISTLVAALHGGQLNVGADSTRPCVQLILPTH